MPSLSPALPVALIDETIVRAMDHVFRTMIQHQITFLEKTEPHSSLAGTEPEVLGSVGFIGAANGLIYLRFPEPYAILATSRILGMTLAETEMNGPEVVKDAMGEITNMTVGGFKNALCDLGYPCKLTLPTIVRGQRITVASVKETTRHVFHFRCEGHRIIADLQLKVD